MDVFGGFLISWTGFSSLNSGILISGGIPNSGIECMDVSDKIHKIMKKLSENLRSPASSSFLEGDC